MPGPAIPKSEGNSNNVNSSHAPQAKSSLQRLNPRTRTIGLLCAAAGMTTMFLIYPYPPKSDTANPFDTKASAAISDRFSKGGAKDHYTPGVATPTNSQENVASGQVGEHRKDTMARESLKAKNYEHTEQASGGLSTRGPVSNQSEGESGRPPTGSGDRNSMAPGNLTR